MKKLIPILFFFFSSFVSAEENEIPATFAEPKTYEEALLLRRIAEFYREGEYELVKTQIDEFLKENPNSHLSDSLYAFIGDLHLREENYEEAIQQYGKIVNEDVREKILLNCMIAFYHMGWYVTLAETCEPYLPRIASYDREKYYKVLFLYADSLYQQVLNSIDDREKQESFAKKARPHFEELANSPFSDEALESLAYICSILEEYEKASDTYLELARRLPDQREEMLFQAANLQVRFDKDKAIQTFGRICHIGKNRVKEASFNRMILFYESEKYAEVILAKTQLMSSIPEDKIPQLHFFVGRSHYFLQDYKRAAADLAIYVEAEDHFNDTFKTGVLTLLDCAKEIDNMPIFNRAFDKLLTYFPKTQEIPLLLFTRAILHKSHKDYYLARKDLEKLMKEFPSFHEKELLHYEHAELFYFTEDWEMARTSFKGFIEDFPNSSHLSQAWRLFLNSSIQVANLNPQSDRYVKEQLTYDLDLILKQKDLLTEKEKRDYKFLLAKTHYEIDEFEEAIPLLTKLLKEPLTDAQLSDAHLLLAFCFKNGIGDLRLFCEHTEKALTLDTRAKDPFKIHLALFNAYLKRANDQEDTIAQAAEHLYQAHLLDGNKLQPDNRRWLIDYYDQKIKASPSTDEIARAVQLIEIHIQSYPPQLAEHAQELEPYLLRLSQLYALQKNYEKQMALLLQLQNLYEKLEEMTWNHQREAMFDLAKAWHLFGKDKKALALFQSIVTDSPTLQTHIAAYSCLESVRIEVASMETRSKEDPNMMQALTQLKNLKLQKTWEHEPIYLEAGLEYIDLLHSMGGNRKELLMQMKDDFTPKQDILSQNYHQGLKEHPNKQHIYDMYMNFIEGEILLCQAEASSEGENRQKCQENARQNFANLSQDDQITPYLSLRVRDHLKQYEKLNVEEKKVVDSQTNE